MTFQPNLFLFILIFSSGLDLSAQEDRNTRRALHHAKRAERAFVAGKFENSILHYTEALSYAPDIGYLYHDRGMAYRASNQPYMAIKDFTKVIQRVPNDDQSRWERGLTYLDINEYARALKDFEYYAISHDHQPEIYLYIAKAHAGMRQYQEALAAADRVLKLKHDFTDAHLLKTQIFLDQRQLEAAKKSFSMVSNQTDKGVYFQLIKGYLQLQKSETDKAIETLKTALGAETTAEEAGFSHYLLANAYQKKQDSLAIIEAFNRAIQFDQEARYYFGRGSYYAEIQDTAAALVDFNRALQIDPTYTGVYNNRTFYIWFPQKKFQHAVNDLSKVIEMDSTNAFAYNNRAYAYRGLNQYERAYLDAFKSMELMPRNPYVYKNLALFYDDFEDREAAKENILKALELKFPTGTDPEFQSLLQAYGLENAY